MTEVESKQTEMTDEEAIKKLAEAMGENAGNPEGSHNVHKFLHDVATAEDTTKIANLRDDKDLNELGVPTHTVRGSLDMALIADKIMENDYFKEFFEKEAENTLATSLSREGFLVRQGTTQTKQVADITKRRKINKGMFGSKKIEETGGDTTGAGN